LKIVLDKGYTLNKGVAVVGTGSKSMVEKTKVKTVINNMEAERKQLAELLGMKMYEMYTQNESSVTDKDMISFITEIEKRINVIGEQREELKRIDEEMSKLTGHKVDVDGAEKTCTCGQAMSENAKFCAKCGTQI
jgi:hypothetical protein